MTQRYYLEPEYRYAPAFRLLAETLKNRLINKQPCLLVVVGPDHTVTDVMRMASHVYTEIVLEKPLDTVRDMTGWSEAYRANYKVDFLTTAQAEKEGLPAEADQVYILT